MIPLIRHPAGFGGPDWIKVLRVVSLLQDDTPVTRAVFEASGNLNQWQWAVRERNEGQVDGRRRRDSPWLAFVAGGQTAAVVRETLAAWAMFCDLEAISASEVAERLRDSAVRDLWHGDIQVWAELVRDPLYLKKREQATPTWVIAPRIPASAEELFDLLKRIEARGSHAVPSEPAGGQPEAPHPASPGTLKSTKRSVNGRA